MSNPVAVDTPIDTVLIFIQPRTGDTIEFLGAEAIGSFDGATVRFKLSRPIIDADGASVLGVDFEALEGAVVVGPTGPSTPADSVGVAAELTADRPGRFEIEDVRLRYRLNGGPERTGTGIHTVWVVCADDPAPVDCEHEG